MMNTDEVTASRFEDLAAGDIYIAPNPDGAGVQGLIVVETSDGKLASFKLHDLSHVVLDPKDVVLVIDRPQIRFDPNSAIKIDEPVPAGALVYFDSGPAVFQPSSTNPAHLGIAVAFSGVRGKTMRDGAPAFARWELGTVRDNHFELAVGFGE